MKQSIKKTNQQKLGSYTQIFTLENTLDTIDLFKQPLPAFNMRGRFHVPSLCGAFASVLITLIVTVYGMSKFIQMMSKHNPNISSWIEQGVVEHSVKMKFEDQPIRIAFGVEGYIDKQLKIDERYVKTFTRLLTHNNSVKTETIIPHRKCRPEDYDHFSPVIKSSQGLFEQYKTGQRDLLCLDWDQVGDQLEIWGDESDEISYQRFEFALLPCNYIHAEHGPTDDYITDGCITDRQQQMDYLSNMKLVILTDEESF